MIDIFDLNDNNIKVKEGNIQVDSSELKTLLKIFEDYCALLNNISDGSIVPENISLESLLELYIYYNKKYVLCGEYRQKEKYWYDILNRLKKGEFKDQATMDQLNDINRSVWENYLYVKSRRENLQREIEKMKETSSPIF